MIPLFCRVSWAWEPWGRRHSSDTQLAPASKYQKLLQEAEKGDQSMELVCVPPSPSTRTSQKVSVPNHRKPKLVWVVGRLLKKPCKLRAELTVRHAPNHHRVVRAWAQSSRFQGLILSKKACSLRRGLLRTGALHKTQDLADTSRISFLVPGPAEEEEAILFKIKSRTLLLSRLKPFQRV